MSGTDPIDTTIPQGRLIFNIFASLAEFERDVIRERTQAGLSAARGLIYRSATLEEAEMALTAFADKWDKQFPTISQIWLRHWEIITPFFDYPPEIRKVIYKTNAIESMNLTMSYVRLLKSFLLRLG